MSPKDKVAPKFDFKAIKPVLRNEVPMAKKGGLIASLPELKELEQVAQYVKKEGVSPYEAFDVLDLERLKKTAPEAAKLKTLVSSFLMAGRRILKQYQVEKKLALRQREDKLFLVSLE